MMHANIRKQMQVWPGLLERKSCTWNLQSAQSIMGRWTEK